ncbi:MAG: glycine reductase, partial [Firmicutes bacterium]|nr:glycine reductase [Bacillota bacterium]
VVAPRFKVGGGSCAFPGLTGPVQMAGEGSTVVVEGVAVVQTGSRRGIQPGVIDMWGPGADYTPFSRTVNLVLDCQPPADMNDVEFDRATRLSALRVAEHVGGCVSGSEPDEVRVLELEDGPRDGELPRIVYIYHLQSQGIFRDTFVYGENVRALLPTLLHPQEVLDGAIVSGNYVIACQKNPTYLHQNNPVVLELAARHGRNLRFVGVIIANEHSTLREKERSARFAAKLARQLRADGAVITQEGGGHADTDLMLTCRECERLGIRTVLLANELAGKEGDLPSLVDAVPEADAVVSTGNNDEVVTLPAPDRVVGARTEDYGGSLTLALSRLYTATNQLGVSRLTAREF